MSSTPRLKARRTMGASGRSVVTCVISARFFTRPHDYKKKQTVVWGLQFVSILQRRRCHINWKNSIQTCHVCIIALMNDLTFLLTKYPRSVCLPVWQLRSMRRRGGGRRAGCMCVNKRFLRYIAPIITCDFKVVL